MGGRKPRTPRPEQAEQFEHIEAFPPPAEHDPWQPPGWARKWGPVLAALVALAALGGLAIGVGSYLLPALPVETKAHAAAVETSLRADVTAARADCTGAREECRRRVDELTARHERDVASVRERMARLEASSHYQDQILWQLATRMGVPAPAPPAQIEPAASPEGPQAAAAKDVP